MTGPARGEAMAAAWTPGPPSAEAPRGGLRAALANRRVREALAQVAGALVLVVLAAALAATVSANLTRLNLAAGFGFLLRASNLRIGESVVPVEPADSFAWIIFAAALNTLRVAFAGFVLATLIGTTVGILRLSTNPLLRALTGAYVELFRNTPMLLQILFWSALLLKLPSVRQAIDLGGVAYLSQRGLQVPALIAGGGSAVPALVAAAAAAVAVGWWRRRARSWARTVATLAAAIGAGAAGLAASGALAVSWPVHRPFGFSGGATVSPEFCALLLGLSCYAGAFIAEIVRGGILAVPRGQWEAARTLGLSPSVTMRRIVLPQALRIIVPAVTTQFVSVVKGSSLAIAIGYPDLFWAVSTTINITGHAVEGVAVLMAAYLVMTLSTSAAMNAWYGRLLRRGRA
jgi:general L-amino acid transport system permease protein